jgi:hypothetical protein
MTAPTCEFVLDTGRRCWRTPMRHGHCAEHMRHSYEDKRAVETLQSAIRTARREMDELGDSILTAHVVSISPERVPEDLCREYRALRYRYNYLTSVLRDRRPGDDLPAEVTMRSAEY